MPARTTTQPHPKTPAQDRTALLRDPVAFTHHDTGDHVEAPDRIVAIETALDARGQLADRLLPTFAPASDDAILRVHAREHLHQLTTIAAHGGAWLDSDTMIGPDSLETARLAAGAAVSAVDTVLAGQARRAFALGRPPGHHATSRKAMGFCLLNSIAIAADHAIAQGRKRVAILDWDVHHGNGTEEIFYGRSDVFFCSLHESPWYPGTGAAEDTGTGEGVGTTLNIPLQSGSGDETWLAALDNLAIPAIEAFNPDLLLVSAGYDAHWRDPLANMQVTTSGFGEIAARARALADRCCGGDLVAVLEGGYDRDALAASVVATIAAFDNVLDRSTSTT